MLRLLLSIPFILFTSFLSVTPFAQAAETLPYIEIPRADDAYPVGVAWQPVDGNITVATQEAIRMYQPDGTLITTLASDEIIRAIAWNPDGTTLAVGLDKGQLQFWQYAAGEFTRDDVLDIGLNAVFSVAYSPNNRMIAVMIEDGFIGYSDSYSVVWRLVVYDVRTHELLYSGEQSHGMQSIADDVLSWSADGQFLTVIGGERRRIVQLDTQTWKFLANQTWFSEIITLASNASGENAAFTSGNFTFFDESQGHYVYVSPLAEINQSPGEMARYKMRSWIKTVDWHPNQALIAVGDRSGDVQILRVTSDSLVSIATLRAHLDGVTDLAWSFNGNHLASLSHDGVVIIWNHFNQSYTPAKNDPMVTFHQNPYPKDMKWIPATHWLVAEFNGALAFYYGLTGKQEFVIRPKEIPSDGRVTSIQFSAKGERLLVTIMSNKDNVETTFLIYEVEVKIEPFEIDLNLIASRTTEEQLVEATLSPSGNQVAYYFGFYGGGHDGRDFQPQAILWNITTDEEQILESGYLQKIQWSSDEKFLLYSKQNNASAHLHDIENSTRIGSFGGIAPLCCGGGYSFRDFDWQADVAAFTSWGLVELWRIPLNEDEEMESLAEIWTNADTLAMSPDGKRLAGVDSFHVDNDDESRMNSANLILWDSETGRPLRLIVTESLRDIQWSSDGKYIAGVDWPKNMIHIWQMDSQED